MIWASVALLLALAVVVLHIARQAYRDVRAPRPEPLPPMVIAGSYVHERRRCPRRGQINTSETCV